MNRSEAVALLKELVAVRLVDASWVSINKKSGNNYQLQIKTDSCDAVREFAESKNLTAEIDKEKRICTIYKL